MQAKGLLCEHGTIYSPKRPRYYCDKERPLQVAYDYTKLKKISWKTLRDRSFNHYRYKELLPATKHIVSMDEGGTSLIEGARKNIYYKLEFENPTGSFKDRGSTCEISHALDMKARHIICASTGNMGASVAAYSARARLPCTIVLPSSATGEKIAQIETYGAQMKRLRGDYTQAMKTAYQMYKKKQGYLAGDYAYRLEGEKSVGFELMDQMPGLDYIIVPIGNGTLISGIWKGIKEMRYAGLIKKLPRLVGVQAKGCNPVYKALTSGKNIQAVIPNTIAGAIACGDPIDGHLALEAVRESKGTIVQVSDKEMIQARRALGHEGVDGEPSGMGTYAALSKIKIPSTKKAALVLCGHGLKDTVHR